MIFPNTNLNVNHFHHFSSLKYYKWGSISVDRSIRDAVKNKIEKFGGFILIGGRGSFQKPNFYIPLIWDFSVRREGVKT